jgi:PAS domain S-box-containing protein
MSAQLPADGGRPANAEMLQLKAEAMQALRQGRFDLVDELLARGDVSLRELTHNLRVYQAELEAQAVELRDSHLRTERIAQQFRRLFDALPQPALVVDRQGMVQRRNDQASRAFGLNGEAPVKPALRRIGADTAVRHALHGVLADAVQAGQARLRGVGLMYADGIARRGDVYVERLDDVDDEAAPMLLVLVVDESERLAAADALAQGNQALRRQQQEIRSLATVARSTHSMVVMTDPQRRITWANDALLALSGYRLDELVGRTPRVFQGPGTDPATMALMRDRLARGEGFTGIEVLNYGKTGEPYSIVLDVQPVSGDDGRLEGFISVQVDVTERLRAEALLRESEAHQRAIFEATPALVAVLRRDGAVANINAAGLAMLQLPEVAQAVGRPLSGFLAPADVERFGDAMRSAMQGQESTAAVDLLGHAGRVCSLEVLTGPLWRLGSVQSVVVIGRDVGAERAVGAMRADKEAAEAASQAKSRFLSQMSHELRTPLNAVLGFTQLMLADLATGSAQAQTQAQTQRSRLAIIEQAGWHLLSMIDDVLDLSRIESGRLDLHFDAVPVAQALADALVLVQGAVERRRIEVHLGSMPAGLNVLADPVRLKQVLSNLLSNAVKYNHDGGRVELRAAADGDAVSISVHNTGRGLQPEQIEHLFEPFNRLGAPSTIEGTGIGLVIVRHLVQLMAGTIEVASVAGESATFTVRLPQPLSPAQSSVAGLVEAPTPPAPRRRTVLYVEDVESNIELMHQALAGTPWTLRVERSGLGGLAAARAMLPDLILLDLQLPDIDGIEVRRQLLGDRATAAIPCVAVTADGAARKAQALGVPFDGWLDKPLRITLMQRLMAQVTDPA